MKKKLVSLLLCVTMVTVLLGGCGSKEVKTDETANTTPEVTASAEETVTEATSTEATSTEATSGKYAIVLKTLSSPFWQSMEKGIKEKATVLGIEVDVYAANSEDDVEGQVTVTENLLSQGYVAIGVAPLSADNLVNVVAEANKSGILVSNIDEKMNMDALASAGGSLVSFITTDNKSIGKLAGEYIVKQITTGDVAIIEGKAGNASGEDRKTGAKEAFEAAGLTIVDSQPADWDRTKAYDLATNLISKNPDLKAIYCCNDTMAMGAQEAVTNSGKEIVVVGTDGNDDAIQSVKDGGLSATIAQDPALVGARSLELLYNAVQAKETPGSTAMIDERIDAILVTK